MRGAPRVKVSVGKTVERIGKGVRKEDGNEGEDRSIYSHMPELSQFQGAC